MEKSASRTTQKHRYGDERDDQSDEEKPTTSRGDSFSPVHLSHNMNDLKALDFNSADEVRQAMKAILTGKIPPHPFSEETHRYGVLNMKNKLEPIKIKDVHTQSLLGQQVHKTVQHQIKQNMYQSMKNNAQAWSCKQNMGSSGPKRRGRPPKAGPSKRIVKPKVSSMYLGKLSNVVPFKRRWQSESESDVESVVIFY